VLINVQLIDAANDHHLWAEAYPRTLDNLFGVEGEVAQKVADALKARLTSAETASVASVPTQNAAAYEWFLKAEYVGGAARQTWTRRPIAKPMRTSSGDPAGSGIRAGARQARPVHAQATLVRDAAHPRGTLGSEGFDRSRPRPGARAADAHLALAFYHYWGFRDYDAAAAEFERTLQLSPNRLEAIAGVPTSRAARGVSRNRDAFRARAGPFASRPAAARRGRWTYVLLRRYEDADRQLRQALAIATADANAIDALVSTGCSGSGTWRERGS
jgi:tetratricopeptide (TPR) repeat protein